MTSRSSLIVALVLAGVLVSAALAAVCAGCGITDVGRERSYGTFASAESGVAVEIVGVQRIPTAWSDEKWGPEENAYVRSLAAADAPRIEFDINGRFGKGLRVDASRDGTWIRIWNEIDPPRVGEVEDVPPDSHVFLDRSKGQTKREDLFRASLIAYVNLRTKFVLRYSSATSEERRERFRLLPELAAEEEVRGEKVTWTRASRR